MKSMEIIQLFEGYPGSTNRGFLGWSSCILLKLPNHKYLLFDTAGFNERYVLLEKLKENKLSVDDIELVFLSHFHFDHAVNFNLFRNATFFIHEKEIEYASTNIQDLAIPKEMLPSLLATNRVQIIKGNTGRIEDITWVLTPGHTPGLCSLFIHLKHENWVLASDAVKNLYELRDEQVNMSVDQKQSISTIRKIKEWADVVIPGHDQPVKIIRNCQGISYQVVNKAADACIEIYNSKGTIKIPYPHKKEVNELDERNY